MEKPNQAVATAATAAAAAQRGEEEERSGLLQSMMRFDPSGAQQAGEVSKMIVSAETKSLLVRPLPRMLDSHLCQFNQFSVGEVHVCSGGWKTELDRGHQHSTGHR